MAGWGGRRFDVDEREIFGPRGFYSCPAAALPCLDEGRWGPILKKLTTVKKGAAAATATTRMILKFGRFQVLPHRREFLAEEVPVALGSRAFDVLMVLIEAGGELVTKDEILSRVWPGMVVEEHSLQFHVSALRKVLGEDRGFIKTISGRGYRFVADTTVAGD